jgi:DNA-binding CsgD family transcriptional regulator
MLSLMRKSGIKPSLADLKESYQQIPGMSRSDSQAFWMRLSGKTYDQIGEQLGVSYERARQKTLAVTRRLIRAVEAQWRAQDRIRQLKEEIILLRLSKPTVAPSRPVSTLPPATELPIEFLRVSTRAYNVLVREGVTTVAQAAMKGMKWFMSRRGCGVKTAHEIKQALEDIGVPMAD